MKRALVAGLVALLLLTACAPKVAPVADTLWLDEDFADGPITFDVTPELWTEVDEYYWEYQYEPTCVPNYTRLINAMAVQVSGGALAFNPPEDVMATFSAYGGTGASLPAGYKNFGDPCPQATKHFMAGTFTFAGGGHFSGILWAHFAGNPAVAVELSDTAGTVTIGLRIDDGMSGEGSGGHLRYVTTATKTTAELVAMSPVTVRCEWQYASSAVATDGWAKLWLNDELIYDETGIALWINYNQELAGAEVNTVTSVSVGYWEAFGASVDNLQFGIPNAETWVPVADFTEKRLDAAQYPGGVARVTCDLWTEDTGSPGPTVTARLVSLLTTRDAEGKYDVDAEVGRSAVITSTVPADASFAVTLSGIKRHRLEVTSDPYGVRLFCDPGAEVGP